MSLSTTHPASYRDPSGFVFIRDGQVFRQVNQSYAADYDKLLSSGLYRELVEKKWLVEHHELTGAICEEGTYKILKPRQISSVNYPYEWCFSQLRDAALMTLHIQELSMKYGMSLKDATPFNIIFDGSHPVFLDTLSFEIYHPDKPWIAYRQFCETFLAPLILAAYRHPDLSRMLLLYPDGIPLSICASLLPFKSMFNSLALLHIFFQAGFKSSQNDKKNIVFSEKKLSRIISHLTGGIESLQLRNKVSTWSDYYSKSILQDNYLKEKETLFREMLLAIDFHSVADLGSNTGEFALILEEKGKYVIALDIDLLCIERLYLHNRNARRNMTTLVSDLMYPVPAIGWNNAERMSLMHRLRVDLVIALALVHHLCIGRNLPFDKLAETLSECGKFILIEFVPKSDEKVQLLLARREDIFPNYDQAHFITAFKIYFDIITSNNIAATGRTLFLMKKKTP